MTSNASQLKDEKSGEIKIIQIYYNYIPDNWESNPQYLRLQLDNFYSTFEEPGPP